MAAYFWVGGTGTWSGTGNTQFATTSGGTATISDPTNADTVTFDANSGTAATVTVTSTAVSLSTTINKEDITLLLSGSPTLCTSVCTLTTGTINIDGNTLTTGSFSSSNTNTRTLAFGSGGTIVVTGTNISIFNISTSTNMNVTGGNRLVEATGAGTGGQTRSVAMGRSFANPEDDSISLTVSAGADTISFTGSGAAFKNVSFVGFTGTLTILQAQVVYGAWNFGGVTSMTGTPTITFAATSTKAIFNNGIQFSGAVTFNGGGGGWVLQDAMAVAGTCTLTAGTLNFNFSYSLTCLTFVSTGSGVRYLAGGGAILVNGTNTTVVNVTYSSDFDTTAGFNYIGLIGNPSTGTRQITGPQSYFGIENDALDIKITDGLDTITFGTNRVWKNIDFTGFKGSTAANTSFICCGNFTLDSGMVSVAAGTGNWRFSALLNPSTIDMGGLTTDVPISFINGTQIQPYNGSWTMASALLLPNSTLTIATNSLPDPLASHTLKLKAGTTNTVGSFVTTGEGQNYLQSTIPGTQATISAASGVNSVSHLTIQDSNATGGAEWYALSSSINAGNNTGWIFSPSDVGFGTGSGGTCFGFGFRI